MEVPGEDQFLSGWSENDFGKLLLHTRVRRFQAGEVVIRVGEVDRSLYIIMDGELEVLVPASGADSLRHVATLKRGSAVGEQAFLDGMPRSALIRAVLAGELLQLTVETFQTFASREPALAQSFLFDLGRIISLRLRRTTSQRQEAAQSPPIRVVAKASLPLHRIEIDQAKRAREVAEICASPFFRELQRKCKRLRRSAADKSS